MLKAIWIALGAVCAASRTSTADDGRPMQLVRVVDARSGQAISGAEVWTRLRSSVDRAYILTGRIGQTERGGARAVCNANGEARVELRARTWPIVAEHGELWGCWDPELRAPGAPDGTLTIALEPDETLRVSCVDANGEPGIGAFVSLNCDGIEQWSDYVRAANGSLEIPHAQYWRALQAGGIEVDVAALVLWDRNNSYGRVRQQLPADSTQGLRFQVAPSGEIAVTWQHAGERDEPEAALLMLRWLSAPADPEQPDVQPELPYGIVAGPQPTIVPGVALGERYEIVLEEVPGWLDPRVSFEGPTRRGERVNVELTLQQRMTRMRGRLIDERGNALVDREFEVALECEGARCEPDGSWFTTDENGRFDFDLSPADGACTLVVVADCDSVDEEHTFKDRRGERAFRLEATIRTHDLGDIVCPEVSAELEPLGGLHLLVFGVLLPYVCVRARKRVVDVTKPLPDRLRSFKSITIMLLVFAIFSLWVARFQSIQLFPFRIPSLASLGAGLVLYAAAVAFMRPRWRRAVEKRERVVHLFMPANATERRWWIAVSLLAGIGEEITWRGVQTVLLSELTGNHVLAVVLCATMFGLAHAVQGWKAVSFIAVFALGFSALVWLSGSLYVAMAVHVVYDITAGLALGKLGRELGYEAKLVPERAA